MIELNCPVINKIVAYKDIIEDYVTEGRNLQSFIISINNTRYGDMGFIIYLLTNFFQYCPQVKSILKGLGYNPPSFITKSCISKGFRKKKKIRKSARSLYAF